MFVCDLTAEEPKVPTESVDLCTLIFVLSSIHPDKMVKVLAALLRVLKPGASVIIRDYGLYDHAMLRFATGRKLQEVRILTHTPPLFYSIFPLSQQPTILQAFYVRQDGTRAYFFSLGMRAELNLPSLLFRENSRSVFAEKLIETFVAAGFIPLSCDYLERTTSNRKEGLSVPRTFVQGRFQKPSSSLANPS